ncbi:MAG: glycosyltransferase family 4 protein [Thermoguttaceae bacterium]|jgi:glycosyltransferase involved in cell wall biosynthesis
MRILIGADVRPDPNAGASGTVYQMNAALRRMGHEVDEIWQPDMGRRIRHGNLHYLLELPWKYRRAVRQKIRSGPYDVIELNQPHAYLAAADHRRCGRPGVFVNRSHGHEVRSEEALSPWRRKTGAAQKRGLSRAVSAVIRMLLNRQWDLIAKTADGFLVSCREDANFLADRYGVPRPRIGVITQGVPDAHHENAPGAFTADRLTRLLYVGQLAFFKAPMMLAQAVSMVLRERPGATMTWVCSRKHHAEARWLLDEDVRSRVAFLDWMTQEELIGVLDRHGVFLFPSFFEGFGKAPLEAMARGLCVVASATGGMRDFIEDGVSGRLVPVGQPQVMAAAVVELMDDLDRCRRMSAAARSTAVTHTWDRCARDATQFYESLIRGKAEQHG